MIGDLQAGPGDPAELAGSFAGPRAEGSPCRFQPESEGLRNGNPEGRGGSKSPFSQTESQRDLPLPFDSI